MTKARLDGLYLVVLGCVVFLLMGIALEHVAPSPLADFRGLYYTARCLTQHHDPYLQSEVLRVYTAAGGPIASDTATVRQIVTQTVYLPTVFSFTVPFALLPWAPAHILWTALTFAALIFASFLIWNLAADYAPVIAGVMVGFFLASSETLIITGNVAGIVISLCAVAAWCFIRERFVAAGVVSLAICLAVKPHDSGLVWLYFLLAGGVYRKRAIQTLLMTIALSLPGVLWVWHVAPNWMQELHNNLVAYAAHGGTNDPGLASTGSHGLAMVVSLQAVLSFFRDDPRIYNMGSYLICAPLLIAWALVTIRTKTTPAKAWLALASIAALTMLPVYHRQYDTKILLLTVPACLMLWVEGGWIGRLALAMNAAGLVLTGDLTWAILLSVFSRLHVSANGYSEKLLAAAQVFPTPLILLVIGVFYLWVYARKASNEKVSEKTNSG